MFVQRWRRLQMSVFDKHVLVLHGPVRQVWHEVFGALTETGWLVHNCDSDLLLASQLGQIAGSFVICIGAVESLPARAAADMLSRATLKALGDATQFVGLDRAGPILWHPRVHPKGSLRYLDGTSGGCPARACRRCPRCESHCFGCGIGGPVRRRGWLRRTQGAWS